MLMSLELMRFLAKEALARPDRLSPCCNCSADLIDQQVVWQGIVITPSKRLKRGGNLSYQERVAGGLVWQAAWLEMDDDYSDVKVPITPDSAPKLLTPEPLAQAVTDKLKALQDWTQRHLDAHVQADEYLGGKIKALEDGRDNFDAVRAGAASEAAYVRGKAYAASIIKQLIVAGGPGVASLQYAHRKLTDDPVIVPPPAETAFKQGKRAGLESAIATISDFLRTKRDQHGWVHWNQVKNALALLDPDTKCVVTDQVAPVETPPKTYGQGVEDGCDAAARILETYVAANVGERPLLDHLAKIIRARPFGGGR
jgi:hypothetical protein